MRRSFVWAAAAICPALALATILGCGCGGTPTKEKEDDNKPPATKPKKGGLTALEGDYTGTISGKITFSGAKLDLAAETDKLRKLMKEKDDAHCLQEKDATEEEKSQFDWIIDGSGGVGNVFVWITPPAGKFFKSDVKDLPKEVELNQPHCAFMPHCLVLCPKHYDDKGTLVSTGQKFKVNSSPVMAHNTKVEGGDNQLLPEKSAAKVIEVEAQDKPIQIDCNVHPWMRAYAGVFNHPYATLTKADGSYEIKNVPVGAEVNIVTWHEQGGFGEGGGKGKSIKIDAKTTQDFKIEKK